MGPGARRLPPLAPSWEARSQSGLQREDQLGGLLPLATQLSLLADARHVGHGVADSVQGAAVLQRRWTTAASRRCEVEIGLQSKSRGAQSD